MKSSWYFFRERVHVWWNNENRNKKVGTRLPLHGRLWCTLYRGENRVSRLLLRVEWSIGRIGFRLALWQDGIEGERGLSLVLPWLSLWFATGCCGRARTSREISIAIHSGSVWWCGWMDPDEYSSREPWYRRCTIHLDRLILGREQHSSEVLEVRQLQVPMPEGPYSATASMVLHRWKRPRWFERRTLTCSIEVPGGIPFEGKGENSWDCGTDATYGISCKARDFAEGVGQLVESVLRDRVRHGGWRDWNWQRPASAEADQ